MVGIDCSNIITAAFILPSTRAVSLLPRNWYFRSLLACLFLEQMASCRISCAVRRRVTRGHRLISHSALSLSRANSSSNEHVVIPESTWSMASLELTSKHQKLPVEEVQRLAHLALLNLEQMPEGLEQDLANMMHMVQQVSDCVADPANQHWFQLEDEFGTFQYDFVRGVKAAPLRGITDPTDLQQEQEAANVWETYLKRKTIRQGGSHKFFAISTKSSSQSS